MPPTPPPCSTTRSYFLRSIFPISIQFNTHPMFSYLFCLYISIFLLLLLLFLVLLFLVFSSWGAIKQTVCGGVVGNRWRCGMPRGEKMWWVTGEDLFWGRRLYWRAIIFRVVRISAWVPRLMGLLITGRWEEKTLSFCSFFLSRRSVCILFIVSFGGFLLFFMWVADSENWFR